MIEVQQDISSVPQHSDVSKAAAEDGLNLSSSAKNISTVLIGERRNMYSISEGREKKLREIQ